MKAIILSTISLFCLFLIAPVHADNPVAAPAEKSTTPKPVTIEVGKVILEADPIEPLIPKPPVIEAKKPLPKPEAAPAPISKSIGLPPAAPVKETSPAVPPASSDRKNSAAKPVATPVLNSKPTVLPPAQPDPVVAPGQTPAQKKAAPPSDLPEPLVPPTRSVPSQLPAETNPPAYVLLSEQSYDIVGPPVDPGRRLYLRSELLLWWQNPQSAPALVTTDTPPGNGFLNSPTRRILYGNGPIGDPFRQGYRFSWGWWGDDMQSCGLDGRFFFLGNKAQRFAAASAQFPVLVRPFFAANAAIFGENGQFVAYPPGFGRPDFTGNVTVLSNSKLWGAELNVKELLCSGSGTRFGYRCDLFAGYRYLNLDENLSIREDVTVGGAPAGFFPPPVLPAGTRALVTDEFSTLNQFHGAQVGATVEARRGPFYVEARFALAMGATVQNLNINGSQFVTQPGQPTQFFAGGLLALPGANIGKFANTTFSVVPELHCHWGYQLFPRTRVFLGYNFLFWSNVIRPGSEIDRVIDVSRVPNFAPPGLFPPIVPARPRPQFYQTGIWAQGLDLGLEFRF